MLEIEEIFDNVIKNPDPTPEDCEEAQAQFKVNFLLVESKEEFLPFLSGYANRLADQLGPDHQKVIDLRAEINRFYDRIPEMISLYRVSLLEDPNDKSQVVNHSADIDDSFDGANKIAKMSNLFNFQIPEDKKPLVTKMLQNVAVLADQKKATRVQLFTKWRYLCLAQKIDAYRIYVPALLTIQKFCARRFNFLYRLKYSVLAPTVLQTSEQGVEGQMSMNQLFEQGSLFQKTKVRRIMAESASTVSIADDANADFAEKLRLKEEQIKTLQDQLRKLSEAAALNEGSEEAALEWEARLKALRNTIAELEAKVLELSSDNDAKRQLLAENTQQLLQSRELNEKLGAEIRQLRKEQSKDALNKFGKVRFLVKVLKNLTQKFTQTGFNKMMKRSIRAIDAIENVSLRMRARLLDQTRSLLCGKDMHRNFLKWFIRSDKNFLREIVTKILINCRITNHTAIYRMKKMAFRPNRIQLTDAMKLMYRCKGAMALQNLFGNRIGGAMKHFVDAINPHKKTKGEAALEKIIIGKFPVRAKNAQKLVFNRFLRRLALEKRTLRDLLMYFKTRQRTALDKLKGLVRHGKSVAKLAKVRRGLEGLEQLVNRRGRDFVDRLKKLGGKSLAGQLEKLATAARFKQMASLSALRNHHALKALEKKTAAFATDVLDLRKRTILQKLIEASKKKKHQTLNDLRLINETENKLAERNRKLGQRVMLSLGDKLKFLKSQALKKLRDFKQSAADHDRKKQSFLGLLEDSMRQKKHAALRRMIDHLIDHKQVNARKMAFLARLLNMLAARSQIKCHKALKGLVKNARLAKQRQLDIQRKFADKLITAKNNLIKEALGKFKANVQAAHVAAAKQEKIKKALRTLADGPRNNVLGALRMMRQNSKEAIASEARNKTKMTDMVKRLKLAQQSKQAQILKKLRDEASRGRSAEEARKRKLESIVGQLAQRNREKATKALDHLRNFNSSLNEKVARREELQRKLLNNLASRTEQKKSQALEKLHQNFKISKDEDLRKKMRTSMLFHDLASAAKAKSKISLERLKSWKDSQTQEEVDKRRKLATMFSQMKRKQAERERLSLQKLRDNQFLQAQKEALMKKKQQQFMNFLLRSEDKRRVALNKLRNAAHAIGKQQASKMDKIKAAINRIVAANRQKQERAVFLLTALCARARMAEELQTIRNNYALSAKNRKKRGLLMLLVSSQQGKQLLCLNHLVRWTNQARIDEAKRRDRYRHKIQRLIDSLNAKQDIALSRLMNNAEGKRAFEKELAAREAKMKAMFGTSPDEQEKKAFDSLSNDFKRPKGPRPRDYGFDSIVQFMNENNRRGKFDPLLDLAKDGFIGNTLELLDRAIADNKDGKYDDLIDRINDRNREAKTIKGFMRASNTDGKTNQLAATLDKNPKLTKAEIVSYVSNNNKDGNFDKLRNYLNNNKKIEDLLAHMRKNNSDGKYDVALDYLRRIKDPKTSELIQFIALDKQGNYEALKAEIAKEDQIVTVPKLLEEARRADSKGSMKPLLDYAEYERVPTIVDLAQFMRQNNQDGRYNPLVALLNKKKQDATVADLIEKLKEANKDEKLNDLLSYLKTKPDAKISDVFDFVNRNNKDGNLDNAVELLDQPNPADKHLKFMNANTGDGAYNSLLEEFAGKSEPKLTDLISRALGNNKDGKMKPLLDKINSEEPLTAVKKLVDSKATDSDMIGLSKYLRNNPRATMSDLVNWVKRNNTKNKFDPVLDVINNRPGRSAVGRAIAELKSNNFGGKNDAVLKEIEALSNPSQIYPILAKHAAESASEKIIQALNNQPPNAAQTYINALEADNADGKYKDILGKLKQKSRLTPSEIVAVLRNANSPIAARIFDLLNLFANQVDYMRRNNSDNKYTPVLEHLETIENPKLHHLLNFLNGQNENDQFQSLLDKIDAEFNKKRLKAFLSTNPRRYREHLRKFEENSDRNIADFLSDVQKSADKEVADEIVGAIDGDVAPRSAGELIRYMTDNNQNGRFTPVLDKLNRVEDPTVSQVIGEVQTANQNHQLDDLLDYFNNKDHGALTDAIAMMRNNNETGRFNPLIEKATGSDNFTLSDLIDAVANHPARDRIADLEDFLNNKHKRNLASDLLNYIRKNNSDGQYNDLLNDIKARRSTPSLLDLARMIQTQNTLGRYNDLIAQLDEAPKDKLVKDILEYAKNNNRTGKFSPFLEQMRLAKQPKLSDIVTAALADNQDEKFDPILEMINGNNFPVSKLLEYLMANNSTGKYDDLIGKMKADPDFPISKTLEDSKKYGPNSELDKFLKFLGEGGNLREGLEDDGADDLFKFLANARRKNEHPEVVKAIEEGKIKNTGQLLDFLNNNNKEGRYNELIQKVNSYSKPSEKPVQSQPTKGLSFVKPAREKMASCLQKLRDAAKLLGMAHKTRMLKIEALLHKLLMKSRIKQMTVVQKLKAFAQERQASQKRWLQKAGAAMSKLADARKDKLREVVGKLQANHRANALADKKKAALVKDLFSKFLWGSKAKQQMALKQLMNNHALTKKQLAKFGDRLLSAAKGKMTQVIRQLKANVIERAKLEAGQVKLLNLIARKQQQRVAAGMQFLDRERIVGAAQETQDKLKKSAAIAKLVNGSKLAMKRTLDDLRAHARQEALKKKNLTAKTQSIVSRLAGADEKLKNEALRLLRNFNAENKAKKARNSQKLADLIRRLLMASKAKQRETLGKLFDTVKNGRLLDKKRNAGLAKMDDLLRRSNQKQLAAALSALKGAAESRAEAERKRQIAIQKLFENLTDKTKAKSRQFFNIGQRQLANQRSKKAVQDAKLRNVLSRLMRGKITSAMERLIINNMLFKIRTWKRKALLNKLSGSSLVKSALIAGKLRNFAAINKLRTRHNATVLNSMLGNLVRKRQSAVLSDLHDKLLRASSKRETAAKFIRNTLLNKERNAFSKLRDLAVVARRNKFNNALSSMLYCLKKNHKVCMRNSLDVWSQKELKAKTGRFATILEKLINKRTGHGLAKIKQEYNMWKYRKVLNGIFKTIDTVDAIQNNIKRQALRDMYAMFLDNNPWFKRIISILAMNTKLTDQVSFWRMRHVKNLKREGVSPMMAIKMKKFFAVIKKQETKNISAGWWNLTKVMDFGIAKKGSDSVGSKSGNPLSKSQIGKFNL